MSEHPNPSAFPWYHPSDGRVGPSCERGMTLRDYFAGQALAMLADPRVTFHDEEEQSHVAFSAYALADAMIAERAERAERAKEPKAK